MNNAKSNPVAACSVVYYEWKNVPCPDNEDAFRVQWSQETMSLRWLLTMFLDSVVALSMHVFIATWQWIQFRDLKKHLRPGTLVTVCDFVQNYLNTFQDEPSGAHWDHEQTTIFPIVNWYRCQKASCDSVVMHEQVFIAPQSQKHDHFAVAAFVKESLRDLKERFGVWIKDIVNWSDNCGRQFKSHGPFFRLAAEPVPMTLAFFGERHGKNDSDDVTGRTKNFVNRAKASRQAVIQSAQDFFNFCHDTNEVLPNFDKPDKCCHYIRTFHFVDKFDNEFWIPKTGLKDTKSFHSVRSVGSHGFVQTCKLSCFCPSCYYDCPLSDCPNTDYITTWTTRGWIVENDRLARKRECQEIENTHFPFPFQLPKITSDRLTSELGTHDTDSDVLSVSTATTTTPL